MASIYKLTARWQTESSSIHHPSYTMYPQHHHNGILMRELCAALTCVRISTCMAWFRWISWGKKGPLFANKILIKLLLGGFFNVWWEVDVISALLLSKWLIVREGSKINAINLQTWEWLSERCRKGLFAVL